MYQSEDFTNVQAGDQIIVNDKYHGRSIKKVDRITATQEALGKVEVLEAARKAKEEADRVAWVAKQTADKAARGW